VATRNPDRQLPTGIHLLHDPAHNKGTAFTEAERDALGLRGLLPPRILTQQQQVEKILENLRAKTSDLEKYIYLVSLQDRNERLFYRVVVDHIDEVMPLIYTPTVGRACQLFGHIWRRARGLFISAHDRGRIASVLRNWPHGPVRVIVVTDGERILGLGDLGANGMGIPIGKLALYTACAGVDPEWCLPITLDVGTENRDLLNDPLYSGLPHHRLPREEYDAFIEEFMQAAAAQFPQALVQFEDFGNKNAFRILEAHRHDSCCFNDDIQGTAAVTLAGIYASLPLLRGPSLRQQRYVFLGAGEAGVGIADLLVAAMRREGVPDLEARARCWLVDSRGLVVRQRTDLEPHKRSYAHDHEPLPDLLSTIQALQPTVLIGVSGHANTFTRPVIEAMSALNERPVIFALSYPTANSECTAEQAYTWSGGRAVFASGSPFGPVTCAGRTFSPRQANNVYVFPGVGLGVIACGARRVRDETFLAAARTLADLVTEADMSHGAIFPALGRIRDVSLAIATAVAAVAYHEGLASVPAPPDLPAFVKAQMYDADYEQYA
jgi:malate dehydrogenase (oxaloacetate-decarboxylating)(NADP+)